MLTLFKKLFDVDPVGRYVLQFTIQITSLLSLTSNLDSGLSNRFLTEALD